MGHIDVSAVALTLPDGRPLLDEVTFPEHVPQNDGVFRPVEVVAPKGTIFNPNFPRACFSRFCQVQRVVDNTILALADQLPQQVTAGNSAGIHFCSYSGFEPIPAL